MWIGEMWIDSGGDVLVDQNVEVSISLNMSFFYKVEAMGYV